MKAVSFFSSIGGMDYAWKYEGGDIVGACEQDEFRRDVYTQHFGKPAWFERDAYNLTSPPPDADIWIAGHAVLCLTQLIEVMNTSYRPNWIWFETMLEAHVGEMLLIPLAALGYRCDLGAFDAADFGLAESRTRLNLIGNRVNADCSWLKEKHHNPWPACQCTPGVMSYGSVAAAEIAQGFSEGYTSLHTGSYENVNALKRQALSGSVAIPAALWVAERLHRTMTGTRLAIATYLESNKEV